MVMNQVDQLLMLTDQEIDYRSFADEILEQLALESDPYIANSALNELSVRKSSIALETAWHLLAHSKDEHFLQSTALRIVFAADREKTLEYMLAHVEDAHPQVLNTLVELLLYESDFRYEMRLANALKQRIAGHEEEMGEYLEPDTISDFVQVMRMA